MKLLDICEAIVDCPHSTAKNDGTGYPLIRTPNVGKGRLKLAGVHRVSENVYNLRNEIAVPQVDDLILAREAPVGNVAIIRQGQQVCLGQRTVLIRPNKECVDPDFLVYYLLSLKLQHNLLSSANGATVSHLNMSSIRSLEVQVPDIEVQKRIGAILARIDDKIELNTAINENLEQQAQALFKAWFVDFEPFKDGEFVDSEFGMIPKGWDIKPLEYLVTKVKSGDWGKDEPTGNHTIKTFCMRGADFPNIKEGNKGKMPIRYILEKNFREKSLCDGNVVVEISGGSPTQSTGRIVLVDKSFIADCDNALICTNFCKSLEIKENYSFFFYLMWQYLYDSKVMFIYENGSNGLKNLNINSLIERESFVIPTKEVVARFNLVASNLLSTKQANGIEISRLAYLRDTLLPKLMSGELRIDEIETKNDYE